VQDITLVLLSAGNSTRFGMPVKKQWLYIESQPLWLFVANSFLSKFNFKNVVVVSNSKEIKLMREFADFTFIEGGSSRGESLYNALKTVKTPFVMVSDIARCCIDSSLIERLIKKCKKDATIAPAIKVPDTTFYNGKPIDRDALLRVQTPQLSDTEVLKEILAQNRSYTDETTAFFHNSKEVIFIEGSPLMQKLTYQDDLKNLTCLKPPINNFKVGFGVDIHPFEDNKEMFLGGIKIDYDKGFKAHSDGDVLIHSLIDALLGASGAGDIGELFPDSDNKYKNIDSRELLKEVIELIYNIGYEIVNVDISIVAQAPKINPYKAKIKEALSTILQIRKEQINIKATTAEKLGFVGRKEGVVVYSTATLNYYQWGRR
jgi:2-C-methyl-D-erythritol 4-phosphate cytidylyltransferase/2-C-methyl-D-erythritol 2,4-cyclodiphosphate synthase